METRREINPFVTAQNPLHQIDVFHHELLSKRWQGRIIISKGGRNEHICLFVCFMLLPITLHVKSMALVKSLVNFLACLDFLPFRGKKPALGTIFGVDFLDLTNFLFVLSGW